MRIAFYAPLKAPDHPVPSGDREMARLLIAALRRGGHAVEVVSHLRAYLPAPDAARQDELKAEAAKEIARISAAWEAPGQGAPELWFTYHNHYKAPDHLGPTLARRFQIAYLLAEASHAPKRAAAWGAWHNAAETASRAAEAHLCFTGRDRRGLAALLGTRTPLIELPPFIDAESWPEAPERQSDGPVRLVTVAMMRAGDKLASYRLLAEALAVLGDLPWHLTVVGDGPARQDVRHAFAALPQARQVWRGSLDHEALVAELAAGHVYVWPGFGEAFGLSYLEAQVMGLPVVALETAGVPSVVRSGETGLLVAEQTPAAYAAAVRSLIQDGSRRECLGRQGAAFVRGSRTMAHASQILNRAISTAQARARLQRSRVPDVWQPLTDALDRAAALGKTIDIWLRDDDAVVVTPALERLVASCERSGMPILLAVIPVGAGQALSHFVAAHSGILPAQHGLAHCNHAAPGQKARELGGLRPVADVTADLRQGRSTMTDLFGDSLTGILVPPWNRIDDAVVNTVATEGFTGLSTFGDDQRGQPGLRRLNCNLDLIDWRNGRVGHSHPKLVVKLVALVGQATADGRPVGLLTHHLAHDTTAWTFLEACLDRLARHPSVRFARADDLLRRTGARPAA